PVGVGAARAGVGPRLQGPQCARDARGGGRWRRRRTWGAPETDRTQRAYSRAAFATPTCRAIARLPGRVDITGMDAPNPSATPTFASRTPLHIGAVGLKVRDLDRVTSFYRDGLAVLDQAKDASALGAGGVRFVHLEHGPNAEPDDPRGAGLYHTAFLMPTRSDLARWILHVARHKVPLTGASDHAVSEAFYLDD